MKASVLHFQDLFHPPIHFVVPVFQRGYVWGQEANWQPLWAEVLDAYRRPAETHFLGTIVLEQAPAQTGSIETRRVVDGQQRLTTIQVILCVIRDVGAERGTDVGAERGTAELVERLAALTANPGRTNTEALKVWPSGTDLEAFGAVVASGGPAALKDRYPRLTPMIVAAYHYFRGRVRELTADVGPDAVDAILCRLVEAILAGLTVVVLDLDTPDDPQSIFESLNARGTRLRAGGLVRNHLFHQCEQAGENTKDLYARFWGLFDSEYWRMRPAGRADTVHMDAFLTDFLIMEQRRAPQSRRLYAEFLEYLRGCGRTAPEVIERVSRFAQHYASLDTDEGLTPAEAGIAGRLRALNVNVFRPVLMKLLADHDAADRLDALRALESYVIRRQIRNLSTSSYGSYLPGLLGRLDGPGPAGAAMAAALIARTGGAKWPTDEEIVHSVQRDQMFDSHPSRIPVFLLLVEDQLRKHVTEPVTVDTRRLTIEHLLPQTIDLSLWPLGATDPAEQAKEERDRQSVLHTLGNLTLVTKELNRKLANRSWRHKRPRLLYDSILNINHELPQEWDVVAIRTRGEWLARHLCAALPRPTA